MIVIVVVAILATISVVAYNGVQQRARDSKIKSDLALMEKAVIAARINRGTPLIMITTNPVPESGCRGRAAGTDLAALNKSTDSCWTAYTAYLNAVSDASDMDIRNIVDPWGRPYYVSVNEDENTTTHVCMNDRLGTYSQPYVSANETNVINIPLYKASC